VAERMAQQTAGRAKGAWWADACPWASQASVVRVLKLVASAGLVCEALTFQITRLDHRGFNDCSWYDCSFLVPHPWGCKLSRMQVGKSCDKRLLHSFRFLTIYLLKNKWIQ
jgi:hypothetical protein